jgi:hypothetical protein
MMVRYIDLSAGICVSVLCQHRPVFACVGALGQERDADVLVRAGLRHVDHIVRLQHCKVGTVVHLLRLLAHKASAPRGPFFLLHSINGKME